MFAKREKELETLIQTVRIYDQDIWMEYGIEKWAMLIIKRGKGQMGWNCQIRKESEKEYYISEY